MRKILQSLAVILLKEFFRLFAWLKIDWKRLILAGAIMTTTGVIMQMFILTDPLEMWTLSLHIASSSDKFFNSSMSFNQIFSKGRIPKLQRVSTDAPIVSLNSSVMSNLSVSIKSDIAAVPKKRSRRRTTAGKVDYIPPPDPSRIPVPHRLQKFISSLTPNEALVYAKREIEHAPEVINDPDLYAPLF